MEISGGLKACLEDPRKHKSKVTDVQGEWQVDNTCSKLIFINTEKTPEFIAYVIEYTRDQIGNIVNAKSDHKLRHKKLLVFEAKIGDEIIGEGKLVITNGTLNSRATRIPTKDKIYRLPVPNDGQFKLLINQKAS